MKRAVSSLSLSICLLFCLSSPLVAQKKINVSQAPATKKADRQLSVGRIFVGSEFSSKTVAAQWVAGHDGYLSIESNKAGNSIVSTNPESGIKSTLVAAEELVTEPGKSPLKIESYSFSKRMARVLIYTNSKRVWRRNSRGDYWVLDRSSRDLKQLGGDAEPSTLMFAKFSPDGSQVAYVRERNIYVEHLDNGTIRKITETPTPEVINGTFDWVYEEELGLRDGYRWSPDGKLIAYWRIDTTGVHKFPLVNNTVGMYPEVQWFAYPKTGQQNPICQIRWINLEDSSQGTVKFDETQMQPGDKDERDHYIARMDWLPTTRDEPQALGFQRLNRLQNTNRVWFAAATHRDEVSSGAVEFLATPQLVEKDDAWIDVNDEMFFTKDNFTWISESNGWRHVYLIHAGSPKRKLLTPGKYDVIELLYLSPDTGEFYFLASPDNATQKFLYKGNLSAEITRLTPMEQSGVHQYNISSEGKWAIHKWSSANQVPTTELIRLSDHKTIRVLEDNKALRAKLATIDLPSVEMINVDIGDGIELDGWCIKPHDFDKDKKYPVLVYVYGEPAGQTVFDRWGGSRYLWHALMAQNGCVVMSFDNRGTPAPKGRAWRKCVYRKVGIMSPVDQANALKKMLVDRPYLDADRVGIWGWSGGGSSTLQAMFKYPDLYHTGISIAPVPNQRYYDTIYQERYMGIPRDNLDGYRNGSAMNFAQHLKGKLLLIHGTGDDNCHYQTTEMLINELIKHNKQFSMMAYPNRTHSIREGRNTTRHLRNLMTNYLLKNLKP